MISGQSYKHLVSWPDTYQRNLKFQTNMCYRNASKFSSSWCRSSPRTHGITWLLRQLRHSQRHPWKNNGRNALESRRNSMSICRGSGSWTRTTSPFKKNWRGSWRWSRWWSPKTITGGFFRPVDIWYSKNIKKNHPKWNMFTTQKPETGSFTVSFPTVLSEPPDLQMEAFSYENKHVPCRPYVPAVQRTLLDSSI